MNQPHVLFDDHGGTSAYTELGTLRDQLDGSCAKSVRRDFPFIISCFLIFFFTLPNVSLDVELLLPALSVTCFPVCYEIIFFFLRER